MSHFVAISSIRNVARYIMRQPRGDPAERLSSFLTVTILSLMSAVLMTSHFWGEPITCWTPAEYPNWWSQFVNQYCYVHGTYYAPLNRPLSWDANARREAPVNYYQWVPYVLAVQALLFYIPRFVWKTLCTMCGVNVPALIRHVDDVWRDCCNSEQAFMARIERLQTHVVPYIWDSLRIQRRRNLGVPTLFACFLMVKVLHSLNAVVQFVWLNDFLQSPHYRFWGIDILRDLQLESVTCVLTLNVYYEKIFLFLWFWLAFVAIVNSAAAIYWLLLFMCTCCHSSLVHKYLNATSDMFDDQTEETSVASAHPPPPAVVTKEHRVQMQTSMPPPTIQRHSTLLPPENRLSAPAGVTGQFDVPLATIEDENEMQETTALTGLFGLCTASNDVHNDLV